MLLTDKMPRGGGGMPSISRHIAPESRFWLRVWPRGDCWEWRGAMGKKGYGNIQWDARQVATHRLAYFLAFGYWPIELDHICQHTWCVRPSHLEDVSHKENVRRRERALGATLLPRRLAALRLGRAIQVAA